jgi:predicted nucleotidyltransferase
MSEHRTAILAAAANRHASNVRVFGSVARGEDADTSHVDLLVDLDPGAHPFDLLDLGCDLEDVLGIKVDIGTPSDEAMILYDNVCPWPREDADR